MRRPPLIVGQAIEAWRGPLAAALRERREAPLREAARLQGFPDVFRFAGSYNRQAAQVGNAVPPVLAARLGAAVLDALA